MFVFVLFYIHLSFLLWNTSPNSSLARFARSYSCYIWATTCDFHQCGIMTSVDSEEPVQPPFKLRNSRWCSVSSLIIFKRLAKALIGLRVYAGWSEALLVVHTTLLEISCRGSHLVSYKWRTIALNLIKHMYKCMQFQITSTRVVNLGTTIKLC